MAQLPLGCPGLAIGKDHLATVAHLLDLVPLRGIGQRPPTQRLLALQTGKGPPEMVAPYNQHRPGPSAVFLLTGRWRQRRGAHLATRRTPQFLQRSALRTAQGMAVEASFSPGWQLIEGAWPTDRTALACRQFLMAAFDTFGPLLGVSPQAPRPRTGPTCGLGRNLARRFPGRCVMPRCLCARRRVVSPFALTKCRD